MSRKILIVIQVILLLACFGLCVVYIIDGNVGGASGWGLAAFLEFMKLLEEIDI